VKHEKQHSNVTTTSRLGISYIH